MNENEGYGFIRPEIIAILDGIVAKYDQVDEDELLERTAEDSYQQGFADGESDYEMSCEINEVCFDPDHQEFMNTEYYDDWLRERSNGASPRSGISVGDIGARA